MVQEITPLRVAEVVALQKASGAARVVADICAHVPRFGVTVAVVSSSPTVNGDGLLDASTELSSLRFPSYGFGALFPWGAWQLPQVCGGQPDIVHFHGVYSTVHVRLARLCTYHRIPYMVSTHGNLMTEAQKRHRMKKALGNLLVFRRFLQGATVIHSLGSEESRAIKEVVPGANVVLIPNGVQADRDRPGVRQTHGRFVFLFLGRLDIHHKGLDLLLAAIGRYAGVLRRRHALFRFVGPVHDRHTSSSLDHLVHRYGIEDLVEFIGPRYGAEKEEVLRSADVFLHTSRYEGQPIAVLEALLSGLPCLVTPGTNMSEPITTSGAGWVCQPNAESIGQALSRVVNAESEDLRQKSQNARSLVINSYRLENTAKQMAALYARIAGESKLEGVPQ